MKTSKKLLMTLVVVGLAGSVIASAVFSAFSSTTTNAGNTISAGTVAISDNGGGVSAMYSLPDQTPGTVTSKCIEVSYTGSLASAVKLYTPSTLAASANYINLKITPGTQASPTFPSCTGFTADGGGAIYNGDMAAFATAHADWATGLALNSGASSTWAQNAKVAYKIDVNVVDTPLAQGATSGTHTFTWEARNS